MIVLVTEAPNAFWLGEMRAHVCNPRNFVGPPPIALAIKTRRPQTNDSRQVGPNTIR